MATQSSILAWKLSWTEEPDTYTVHEIPKSWKQLGDWTSTTSVTISFYHPTRETVEKKRGCFHNYSRTAGLIPDYP